MDGWLRIGTKVDTKNFDSQIEHVENQIAELEEKLNQIDAGEEFGDIAKIEVQYEKLKNQLIDLRKKQEDLNKTDLRNLEKTIDNIGDSTSKTIKKVSKWALAVFGVRSAYMFVRQSMSTLTQYNEQLATDVDYISFAISSSLEPLIEKLVQLVFQLLYYVNALAKAWFNVDLFANASADRFASANKNAKELKKTIAGFDEMNVVSSGSTSQNNIVSPSFDLSTFADEQEVEDIKNFWDNIVKFWEEDIVFFIDNADGMWGTFFSGLGLTGKGLYDTLKGVFQLILGLLQIIVGAFTGNFDLIKKSWDNMCSGLKNIFSGLIEIIGGLLTTALGFLKGLFLEIVGALANIFINPFIAKFEKLVNAVISGLNWLATKINKLSFTVPDWVPGIGGEKIGFNFKQIEPVKLPRLKSGGIINQPGRGVPLGIGGEAGKEGVIPLTDSQAMEELGSAIGRYITINATLINQMNGRTISRELKKVQNESAFATNR